MWKLKCGHHESFPLPYISLKSNFIFRAATLWLGYGRKFIYYKTLEASRSKYRMEESRPFTFIFNIKKKRYIIFEGGWKSPSIVSYKYISWAVSEIHHNKQTDTHINTQMICLKFNFIKKIFWTLMCTKFFISTLHIKTLYLFY